MGHFSLRRGHLLLRKDGRRSIAGRGYVLQRSMGSLLCDGIQKRSGVVKVSAGGRQSILARHELSKDGKPRVAHGTRCAIVAVRDLALTYGQATRECNAVQRGSPRQACE